MGAFLILLLNFLVLSAPAYASAGSVLPIEATSAVGGGAAQSADAQSANSAVQPAVAPVTKAIAQTVEKTTAPVTEADSKVTPTVTAPASGVVTQSVSKVATPVLDATAQTIGKTAAPVLQTAAKAIGQTAAPVVGTAMQSVGKTAAPVLKTAASTLDATTQVLVKTAAPVLQTATHVIGGVSAPLAKVTTSTVAGVVQGAGATTALVGKVASQGTGQVTALTTDSTVTQAVPRTITGTGHLPTPPPPTTPSPMPAPKGKTPSNPIVTTTEDRSGTPFSVVTIATPSTTVPSSGVLPSHLIRPPQVPLGVSSSGERQLLSALPTPLAQAGTAWLAQLGSAIEPLAAIEPSQAGDDGRHVGSPPASSIPASPVPSPVPGGSSGAMASAAGSAFSIFLTLAGLLLMGGLAAMRRLRLASELLRAARFVLIPERPG